MALLRLNRYDAPELTRSFLEIALLLRGEPLDQALQSGSIEAMIRVGRFEDLLKLDEVDSVNRAVALRGLGRLDEAVALGDAHALAQADAGPSALVHGRTVRDRLYLLQYLALRAFFSGDVEGYRHHRDLSAALPCSAYWDDVWVHRYLLFPLVDELSGDPGAFVRSLRESLERTRQHWYGKLWATGCFVLGDMSEAQFLDQPCRLFLQARLSFARALRAEAMGEHRDAAAHYRAYLSLPFLERSVDSIRRNPLIDRWASFRS
jgi:hypothetical protein